jgi:hypothetical protein
MNKRIFAKLIQSQLPWIDPKAPALFTLGEQVAIMDGENFIDGIIIMESSNIYGHRLYLINCSGQIIKRIENLIYKYGKLD